TECGARIEIRTDVEKRFKVVAITGFPAGEMEGNWQATEVGLQVNLGRETATRAAKCLIMLPPFAPAAETWARNTVESNTKLRRLAHRRQGFEESFESSRSAQA